MPLRPEHLLLEVLEGKSPRYALQVAVAQQELDKMIVDPDCSDVIKEIISQGFNNNRSPLEIYRDVEARRSIDELPKLAEVASQFMKKGYSLLDSLKQAIAQKFINHLDLPRQAVANRHLEKGAVPVIALEWAIVQERLKQLSETYKKQFDDLVRLYGSPIKALRQAQALDKIRQLPSKLQNIANRNIEEGRLPTHSLAAALRVSTA